MVLSERTERGTYADYLVFSPCSDVNFFITLSLLCPLAQNIGRGKEILILLNSSFLS